MSVAVRGLPFKDLWYINAHATSTPRGDVAEMKAIDKVASSFNPHISSNKGQIGHLLGAAGAVETGFTCLSLKTGIIPKNYNLENVDKEIPNHLKLVKGETFVENSVEKRFALKNSFGFGGTNATLFLSNYVC